MHHKSNIYPLSRLVQTAQEQHKNFSIYIIYRRNLNGET